MVQTAGPMNEPLVHKAALSICPCTRMGALQWCQELGPDSPVARTSAQTAAGEVLYMWDHCAHPEPSVHSVEEVNADRQLLPGDRYQPTWNKNA